MIDKGVKCAGGRNNFVQKQSLNILRLRPYNMTIDAAQTTLIKAQKKTKIADGRYFQVYMREVIKVR